LYERPNNSPSVIGIPILSSHVEINSGIGILSPKMITDPIKSIKKLIIKNKKIKNILPVLEDISAFPRAFH